MVSAALRLIVPLVGLLFLGLLRLGDLDATLANNGLDLLFRLRGPIQPDQRIILIGIDEPSLQQHGAWPFPRALHAALLERLTQANAIGFDFIFAEPTPDDPQFSAVMANAPPVVLTIAREFSGKVLQPAASLTHYAGTGHIETMMAGDGIVRRFLPGAHGSSPAFSQAMLHAAGLNPAQAQAAQPQIINFYGPEESFLYLSYADVLAGTVPPDFFAGKLVLVGARATGLNDSHITSYTHKRATPGVEIQATIISNLLQGAFIKPLPAAAVFALLLIGLGALFLWPVAGERINLTINLCLLAGILLSAFLLFSRNFFFDYPQTIVFLFLAYLAHLFTQLLQAAGRVVNQARTLGEQLDAGLQQVYTNIPQQFITAATRPGTPAASGIQRHLDRLQAVIHALSLQHHFLENLLRKELPPLILWEQKSGAVIFANTGFARFWSSFCSEAANPLPRFANFLERVSNQDGHTPASAPFPADTPTPGQLSARIQDEHGRTRHYQVIFHGLEAGDTGFQGLMTVLQDVTELKELERVKDEVVSIVSHELKLPLTTILGYGEILTDSLSGDHQHYALAICDQSRRLNRMIEDFLDIARLESGRQAIRRYPFPLTRMLDDAVSAVTPRSRKKSITLVLNQPPKTTPYLGDEPLLLQAVINLLDNAIKFSPEQSRISLTLTEEPSRFSVQVTDQGPGIPPEDRARIFDKFQRGTYPGPEKGFGLGLHLVKQIIGLHHGEIAVTGDTPGATFQIHLPKHFPPCNP